MQAETEARERRQQQQNAYRQARSALIEQLETLEQQCRQSVAEGNFDYSELQCTAEQWLQQWQALPHGEFDGDTGTPAPLLGRLEQLAASADAQEKIAEQLDRLLAQPVDDAGPGKLRKQQQQLESLLQRVNWPDGLSRPESLKRAEKRLREIDSRRQALNQQSRALQQSLQEQLDSLEQAIAEGHVKQAGKHHQRAADALELLNGQAAGALDQRFRQLHAQLQELRDWQGFAVTPKKEQLCADMEALIDSELPTPERAEAIRRLQQQWKELDSTDAYHSQALWRRFKEASDRAYAPCEDYFLALGEQRRENLKQRGIICEQLETYIASIDWDAPDWKGIETISRAAKQEWKHYSPVDRGPGKELQQRFNGLLQQLDGRLQGHFQQCLELKRDLVARTAALCDAEDPHQAARDARQLQQEWKAAGKTYRNQEQRLWKQFRSHCDSIFARLSDSQQQHRQQQDEQREQAESACQQLEQLLDRVVGRTTIATALAQARETFDGLDQAFCASFARRFDKAAEQLARQCRELEELQASAGLQALERRAGLCDELESLLGADSEDSEPLAELQQNWRALPACSSEFSELIEQRYQLVLQTLQEPDLLPELTEAAGERLRQLCIQLEIALGLPSPDEDQALRLEYQMQRLQQALEQHSQTTRLSDLQRLEYEWRCIPSPAATRS
ncbi:DUF349 domain-containing protein [Marinobacterium aestuariivivens]|uniref:DUF349 domain-containing protein n=1 Tax=Marinobacterium aestuariivivens TaxID=1698799 RepID=A0ABW1ZWH3_9GAMM